MSGAFAPQLQHTVQKACKKGDIAKLRQVFSSDVGIDTVGENGFNVIHYAAYYGNRRLLQELVDELDADIDAITDKRNSALHIAVYEGQAAVFSVLVSLGIYIDALNEEGQSAIDMAVNKRNRKVLSKALPGGVDMQTTMHFTQSSALQTMNLPPSAPRDVMVRTYRRYMRDWMPDSGSLARQDSFCIVRQAYRYLRTNWQPYVDQPYSSMRPGQPEHSRHVRSRQNVLPSSSSVASSIVGDAQEDDFRRPGDIGRSPGMRAAHMQSANTDSFSDNASLSSGRGSIMSNPATAPSQAQGQPFRRQEEQMEPSWQANGSAMPQNAVRMSPPPLGNPIQGLQLANLPSLESGPHNRAGGAAYSSPRQDTGHGHFPGHPEANSNHSGRLGVASQFSIRQNAMSNHGAAPAPLMQQGQGANVRMSWSGPGGQTGADFNSRISSTSPPLEAGRLSTLSLPTEAWVVTQDRQQMQRNAQKEGDRNNLAAFLAQIGLSEWTLTLSRNGVTEKTILTLSEDHLRAYGVTALGARKKIVRHCRQVRGVHSPSPSGAAESRDGTHTAGASSGDAMSVSTVASIHSNHSHSAPSRASNGHQPVSSSSVSPWQPKPSQTATSAGSQNVHSQVHGASSSPPVAGQKPFGASTHSRHGNSGSDNESVHSASSAASAQLRISQSSSGHSHGNSRDRPGSIPMGDVSSGASAWLEQSKAMNSALQRQLSASQIREKELAAEIDRMRQDVAVLKAAVRSKDNDIATLKAASADAISKDMAQALESTIQMLKVENASLKAEVKSLKAASLAQFTAASSRVSTTLSPPPARPSTTLQNQQSHSPPPLTSALQQRQDLRDHHTNNSGNASGSAEREVKSSIYPEMGSSSMQHYVGSVPSPTKNHVAYASATLLSENQQQYRKEIQPPYKSQPLGHMSEQSGRPALLHSQQFAGQQAQSPYRRYSGVPSALQGENSTPNQPQHVHMSAQATGALSAAKSASSPLTMSSMVSNSIMSAPPANHVQAMKGLSQHQDAVYSSNAAAAAALSASPPLHLRPTGARSQAQRGYAEIHSRQQGNSQRLGHNQSRSPTLGSIIAHGNEAVVQV